VRHYGFVEPDDLSVLAARCGYAVSASRYEGYGLSIVEGMSVGLLPVVQCNAAFLETVSLSGCGMVTDFGNPEQAASEFLAWQAGVTDADRDRAIQFARAQSWDHVVKAVDESYRAATRT
jgi:alpha-1,3-mannosyltransferase